MKDILDNPQMVLIVVDEDDNTSNAVLTTTLDKIGSKEVSDALRQCVPYSIGIVDVTDEVREVVENIVAELAESGGIAETSIDGHYTLHWEEIMAV